MLPFQGTVGSLTPAVFWLGGGSLSVVLSVRWCSFYSSVSRLIYNQQKKISDVNILTFNYWRPEYWFEDIISLNLIVLITKCVNLYEYMSAVVK